MKQLKAYTCDSDDFERLCAGTHHDPFSFLGIHPLDAKRWIIRAWLPTAVAVRVVSGPELESVGQGLFAAMRAAPNPARATCRKDAYLATVAGFWTVCLSFATKSSPLILQRKSCRKSRVRRSALRDVSRWGRIRASRCP